MLYSLRSPTGNIIRTEDFTANAPEVRDNTHIQLGNVLLSMEGIVLSEITQAPELLQRRREKPCNIWGKISVIKLESRNNRYKLTFRCQ